MNHLRRLNANGITEFGKFLVGARSGGDTSPPKHLLSDHTTSEAVLPTIDIPIIPMKTKRDAAELLVKMLAPLSGPDLLKDSGVWAWLALHWFDEICPAKSGRRKVNKAEHYIPDFADHRRRYRQLLVAPYIIRQWASDHNALWLDAQIEVHGDLMENTLGRLYLVRVPGIRAAMEKLYLDPKTGRIRSGLFPKREQAKPGDIRNRLPLRIQQLQRTYDVEAVDGDSLIGLLGAEFERWRTNPPVSRHKAAKIRDQE